MLDVSLDSVFLVAACEDNQLYLRSLATGTEIHCLKGHKSEVSHLDKFKQYNQYFQANQFYFLGFIENYNYYQDNQLLFIIQTTPTSECYSTYEEAD